MIERTGMPILSLEGHMELLSTSFPPANGHEATWERGSSPRLQKRTSTNQYCGGMWGHISFGPCRGTVRTGGDGWLGRLEKEFVGLGPAQLWTQLWCCIETPSGQAGTTKQ
jgi:hypothetical protein